MASLYQRERRIIATQGKPLTEYQTIVRFGKSGLSSDLRKFLERQAPGFTVQQLKGSPFFSSFNLNSSDTESFQGILTTPTLTRKRIMRVRGELGEIAGRRGTSNLFKQAGTAVSRLAKHPVFQAAVAAVSAGAALSASGGVAASSGSAATSSAVKSSSSAFAANPTVAAFSAAPSLAPAAAATGSGLFGSIGAATIPAVATGLFQRGIKTAVTVGQEKLRDQVSSLFSGQPETGGISPVKNRFTFPAPIGQAPKAGGIPLTAALAAGGLFLFIILS